MTTAGQIGIDLILNSTSFKKSLNNIQTQANNAGSKIAKSLSGVQSQANIVGSKISNSFSKIAKVVGTAFSVAMITRFSKECVSAANIQTEAETKLTTVMRQRMSASNKAISSVKNYASALQETGVVGDEVQLAGAQQLSTFLKTDDALKKLMPAMNNLAVQQNGVNVTSESMVNIGNLMGKVMQGQTSALTRVGITFSDAQAQVLKYGNEEQRAAMLSQVITDNVGNMNKALANTPAGRIQQLKNSFGDMQETLGRGLNNVFSPMLGFLTKIVTKLSQVASGFENLTKKIFGDSNSEQSSAGMNNLSTGADNATTSVDNNTKAINNNAKAKKKAERSLANFDKLNVLTKTDTSDTSSTGTSGTTSPKIDNSSLNKADKTISKIKGAVNSIVKTFNKGFKKGFGDTSFEPLKKNVQSIGKTLGDIFTNKDVQKSAKKCAEALVENLGIVVGSALSIGVKWVTAFTSGVDKQLKKSKDQIIKFLTDTFGTWENIFKDMGDIALALKSIFTSSEVLKAVEDFGASWCDLLIAKVEAYISIGTTIAFNIVEGIKKYINQNVDIIKERIVSMFDIASRINKITAKVYKAFADIFSVFRSGEATQCTADIIGIFTNGISGALVVLGEFATDIYDLLVSPITDNAKKIKTTLKGLFKPLSNVLHTIKKGIDNTFSHFQNVYNKKIHPAFMSIKKAITEVFGVVLDAWNKYIQPVLTKLSEKFSKVWKESIQPAINRISDGVGKVFTKIKDVFNYIKPAIEAVIKVLSPIISAIVSAFGTELMEIFKGLFNIVSSIVGLFIDLGSIVVDLFTGNFDGLKEDLSDLWDDIVGIFSGIIDVIKAPFVGMDDFFSTLWDNIKDIFSPVIDWFSNVFSSAWTCIKSAFSSVGSFFCDIWSSIKNVFASVGNWFSSVFKGAWSGIKSAFSSVGKFFVGIWNGIKKVFSSVGTWFSNIFSGAWNGIKKVWNGVCTFFSNIWKGIKNVFSSIGTWFGNIFKGAWNGIKSVFSGVGKWFKNLFNGILKFIKAPINFLIDGLNTLIKGVNKISFDVPKWVPGIGGKKFGFDIPQIPHLAKGGLVKAPTLAVVGDNMGASSGNPEVVSPLNKLKGMIQESSDNGDTEILSQILLYLKRMYEMFIIFRNKGGNTYEFVAKINGSDIFKEIVKQNEMYKKRHNGKSAFV